MSVTGQLMDPTDFHSLVTSILQNIFHMSCFALDHLSMYMTYFLYLSVHPMEHTYNIQYSFFLHIFIFKTLHLECS